MKFKTVFFPLLLVCLLLLAVSLSRSAAFDAAHAARTLQNTLDSTCANTEGLSPAARQQALVFHQQAQLALLDDAKQILAQSGEFLILRDGNTTQIAMLAELTESERNTLYAMACKDEVVAQRILQHAAAFEYEAYPYGSIVYPQSMYGIGESVSVTKPLTLYTKPLDDGLLSASLHPNGGEAIETTAWLPYLRAEAPNNDRFAELLSGAKLKDNLFTREQLQLCEAPEGIGARYLAVYQSSHPLGDFLTTYWGDLLIGLFLSAFVSAALSLGICKLIDLRLKKRTA